MRQVSNPNQIAGLHRRFSSVNAGHHAIGPVHQKRDGTVVHFDPLERIHVLQKASEGQEDTALLLIVKQLDDKGCSVDKHRRPRPVFCHLQKSAVHVQVDGEIVFQRLQEGSDMFSPNGSSLPDGPFVGHGLDKGGGAIILGHRAVEKPKPYHRIMAMWCTIRTFSKHALELGNQPAAEPILFVKPAACLHKNGPLPVSQHPGEVHHEVECVVRVNADLEPVALAVGLDLTDRATQRELRAEQLPWAKAKCFSSSAVVGPWSPWDSTWEAIVEPGHGLHLSLEVNGTLRQSTPLHEMSVTPRQQIESLRTWAPVVDGDMLFTGTPQGVGELHPGDRVVARLTNGEGVCLSEIDVGCA